MSSFGDLNRVNTNVESLNSQLSLNKINRDLAQSQLRMSTGLRINRAEDDAAGFSMAMTFQARTNGLTEAMGNVADAKGLLDVAEANFDVIFDNLLEMKNLATRAGTDSMGDKEREDIGTQISALGQNINDIADQAVYQDKTLLAGDGSGGNLNLDFLVGERGQDLLSVELEKVDMNSLFTGSNALQNVASTTVENFGVTGGDAATHIAIKVGSTMSSEKHIIKLVDDVGDGGWTGEEITSMTGSGANGIRGHYGEEFLDTLIAQIDAKNIDGVSGEKVEEVAEVLGEYSWEVEGGFEVGSTIEFGGVFDGAADLEITHVGGDNPVLIGDYDTGVTDISEVTEEMVAEGIAEHINANNDEGDDFYGFEASADGANIILTETYNASGNQLQDGDITIQGDGDIGEVEVLTESVQSEWSFVLHNTNTDEVSFSLQHTTEESASTTYTQVGKDDLSVAAADEPNNVLEFDQRGSGENGMWTAEDYRNFLVNIDNAITNMTGRVNDVGIAQSSLSKREETLSQSITANSAAISRIMDTDFAKEQSESIRLQILQQTATSALAQANMGPQSVLGFLG